MDNFDVFEFYQFMQKQNVILSFKGEMSQQILVNIGDLLKEKLASEDTEKQVTKKVFFIFVELAQNIHRYSADRGIEDKKRAGTGVLFVKESANYFTIFAGNRVAPLEAKVTTEQCLAISRLTPNELKLYYKEQLKQPREDETSGAAGLGLISIVRKAENPIVAYTIDIDTNETFLVLSVQVNKE